MGSNGRSIRWSTSPGKRAGAVGRRFWEDPFLGSASQPRRFGVSGPRFCAPDKMAATVKHFAATAPRSPGANTTRSICPRSSCSTTISRRTRQRSTQERRRSWLVQLAERCSEHRQSIICLPRSFATSGVHGTTVSDYQAVQDSRLRLRGEWCGGRTAWHSRRERTSRWRHVGPRASNPIFHLERTAPVAQQARSRWPELNNAVRHVLTLKYLAGLFTTRIRAATRAWQAEELTPRTCRPRVPRRRVDGAAQQRNHALPLSTSTAKIAVVGPLADDALDQLGPMCRSVTTPLPAYLKATDKS